MRQSDAHAWAEIWLDGRGWVRIDPTTVVAPERLQRRLEDLMPDRGRRRSRLHACALAAKPSRLDGRRANWWQERIVNYNLASPDVTVAATGHWENRLPQLALILLAGVTHGACG